MIKAASLYPKFKQAFDSRGKASFWFGGIFACLRQYGSICQYQIIKNISSIQYCQLLKIMNICLQQSIQFTQQQSDDFFQYLSFCGQFLHTQQTQQKDYSIILSRLVLKNTLIVYSLKTRNYNFVFQQLKQIGKEFRTNRIDQFNQVYLTIFSNYKHVLNKLNSTKRQIFTHVKVIKFVEENLILIFSKNLQKIIRSNLKYIPIEDILLLIAVYVQNQDILQNRKDDLIYLIEQTSKSTQKIQHLKQNVLIKKLFKQKIIKQIHIKIILPFYQFCYYYQSQKFQTQKSIRKLPNTRDNTQKQQQRKLTRIQKILNESISLLNHNKDNQLPDRSHLSNRFRRLSNLNGTKVISPIRTIDFRSDLSQQLPQHTVSTPIQGNQTISYSSTFTIRPQITSTISPSKYTKVQHLSNGLKINQKKQPILSCQSPKTMHFKMGSIFIQTNDDGLLLSDYTKQNQRYIQWNTISLLLTRLQYNFVYQQLLKCPIYTHYDLVRIIQIYITKNQHNHIALEQYPQMLLQLNQFVKFYPQQYNYTKLVLMNIYDNTKIQANIDCYFQEFYHFFRNVSDNAYIKYLNAKIFISNDTQLKKNQVFYLQVLRKSNQSIKTQLQNQLTVQTIQKVSLQKSIYKSLMILKNNMKLSCTINVTQSSNSGSLNSGNDGISLNNGSGSFQLNNGSGGISLNSVNNVQKTITSHYTPTQSFIISIRQLSPPFSFRSLQIACHKLFQYIPLYNLSQVQYIKKYGRLILEFFNNFQELEGGMRGMQFQVLVHYHATQMIQIGKYFTTISLQVIGTKYHVVGVVVRYNFLPKNQDYVTFLCNPYHGFLADFIHFTRDKKKQIFKKLLINSSVKQTYLYLEKTKKLNQVSSLIQYLSEGVGLI